MVIVKRRSRTPSKYIYYALHLYFSGLSLRKTSQHLSPFIRRNHVSIWNWIQRQRPEKIFHTKRSTVSEFIVDETIFKGGDEFVFLWVAIEPLDKVILGIRISFERSMADFLPLLHTGDFKMGIIDFVIKIIGGAVTFGLIAIALRRRFERRYRH